MPTEANNRLANHEMNAISSSNLNKRERRQIVIWKDVSSEGSTIVDEDDYLTVCELIKENNPKPSDDTFLIEENDGRRIFKLSIHSSYTFMWAPTLCRLEVSVPDSTGFYIKSQKWLNTNPQGALDGTVR